MLIWFWHCIEWRTKAFTMAFEWELIIGVIPYECVAFVDWIRFRNGNSANNKAIFVVVIVSIHNIHIHTAISKEEKKRDKKQQTSSHTEEMKEDEKQIKLYFVYWIEVDYLRWIWPLNDRFELTALLLSSLTPFLFCFAWYASSLYCVNVVLTLLPILCADSFTSLFNETSHRRWTVYRFFGSNDSGIKHFSMTIRIKVYK